MKQFIKYVCATVVGVFLVVAILTILSFLGLITMAAFSETAKAPVENNSVLVLQLEGSIAERSQENPFAKLMGNSALEEQGLDDILAAISNAKQNDKIKGIYIEAGSFDGAMPSTLQEIRNALVDFKKDGKFIVSYGDTYTQGAYYLCSVADSVIINPQGMINLCGLASQVVYYKDFLDKIGVQMEVVKVGTYKSAVEPFLISEMSEANREQIEVYDGEIWSEITKAISKSRGVSEAKINELADSAVFFAQTKTYLKEKLVDKIAYSDEVPAVISNLMGSDDDYITISVSDLAAQAADESASFSDDVIAVYYAVGDIVDEDETGGFDTEPQIVSRNVISDLKELADDDDVKAVVLRVNSGGGSAYASEQIWHQVMNIKAKKPIVVSMGDMAASGGYYISCAADYIYAEPTTLTGSIGIFGMFPTAGELLNNTLGLHFCTVKTNEYADLGDFSRPFSAGERNVMQRYVNDGYELFTKRCADGRKMKQDDIKKIGEGRVWTGIHAKQIGLVDGIGGIDAAVKKAKELAKAEKAKVTAYPAKGSIFDSLLDEVEGGSSYADAQMKSALGDYYSIYSNLRNVKSKTGLQTSLPYCLKFNL